MQDGDDSDANCKLSEPPKVFGAGADYWELHNGIANKYDADLMDRLNTGLDNLLIFVSVDSLG